VGLLPILGAADEDSVSLLPPVFLAEKNKLI